MLQLNGKDCQSRYSYMLSQRDRVNMNKQVGIKRTGKKYHANTKTTKTKVAILFSRQKKISMKGELTEKICIT